MANKELLDRLQDEMDEVSMKVHSWIIITNQCEKPDLSNMMLILRDTLEHIGKAVFYYRKGR